MSPMMQWLQQKLHPRYMRARVQSVESRGGSLRFMMLSFFGAAGLRR
jgi:hypothetical protein